MTAKTQTQPLAPGNRVDFNAALVPPDGYALAAAIGTTFSMDFPTALTVPVALALRGAMERDEITASPLAALAAMQRLREKVMICVEAGNIHASKGPQSPLVALAGTGFRVSSQGGHRNCLYEGETGRFRTRPDLIVRQGEKIALIIDTKWKRMTPRIDDPKQGVSQTDVYQLMAYGRLYDCPNVMLLYPHHGDLPPDPICRRYSIATRGAEESLTVATQDLAGSLRSHKYALRQLVLECLPNEGRSKSIPDSEY